MLYYLFSLYASALRACLSMVFYGFIATDYCVFSHSVKNKRKFWQKIFLFCVPCWVMADLINAYFILDRGSSLYVGICQVLFLTLFVAIERNSLGFLSVPFWTIPFALCQTGFEMILNVGMLAFQFYLRSLFIT